jgi:hypothetical protein
MQHKTPPNMEGRQVRVADDSPALFCHQGGGLFLNFRTGVRRQNIKITQANLYDSIHLGIKLRWAYDFSN